MTTSLAEELGYGWAVVIDLAESDLPWIHELRDPHTGEWIHAPGDKPGPVGSVDRYVVPDPHRLFASKGYVNPADHPFFREHPVSAANIVAAYDQADPGTRAQGMRWYSDVHDLANKITGGDPEKGGILLSAYSPQTSWPVNMFNAAESFRRGSAIRPGEGIKVTNAQADKAQKALDGQGIETLMQSAKTHAFGRLIATGDDSPDDPYGTVVVDTHAVNVAAGGNIRQAAEKGAPIGKARFHEYVADQYREAAHEISQRDGVLIKPHQLQAITWLAQQRANQGQDAAGLTGAQKGRAVALKNAWSKWMSYADKQGIPVVVGSTSLAAEALFAQVIELVGADSLFAQLTDLAAWQHELRDPHTGRWVRAGDVAGLLAPSAVPPVRVPRKAPPAPKLPPLPPAVRPVKPGTLAARRARAAKITTQQQQAVTQAAATPVSAQQLGRAVVDSKIYTAREVDQLRREIADLKDQIDNEGDEEGRGVMALHIGFIVAGIGVGLAVSGIALPIGIALLIAAAPPIASEIAEYHTGKAAGLSTGPGALSWFGHPIAKMRFVTGHPKPVSPPPLIGSKLAGEPDLDTATAMLTGWLSQTGLDATRAQALAEVLVDSWAEQNKDRLARARAQQQGTSMLTQLAGELPPGSLVAQVIDLRFDPLESRGPHGEWTRGGDLPGREAEYQQTKAQRVATRTYPVIGSEGARGNSRAVSADEFQHLASQGNAWIDKAKRDASPITGLDQHWDQVKSDAWHEVQKSWGGATIDTHTGKALPQGADVYALSVKPRGMDTVSVPEHATEAEFNHAMDQAKEQFRPALERKSFYLGVFHDDETGRIDIDPVAIVDSVPLVEQVGAYTRAIGGAYHFKSGDGFWPPHVAEGTGMANDDDTIHWAGPGQWHTQAVTIQDPEPGEPDARL